MTVRQKLLLVLALVAVSVGIYESVANGMGAGAMHLLVGAMAAAVVFMRPKEQFKADHDAR